MLCTTPLIFFITSSFVNLTTRIPHAFRYVVRSVSYACPFVARVLIVLCYVILPQSYSTPKSYSSWVALTLPPVGEEPSPQLGRGERYFVTYPQYIIRVWYNYFMIKFFTYVILFLSLFTGASANAQGPFGNRSGADLDNALNSDEGSYPPPAIYIRNTKVNPADASGKLTGTFTMINKDDETLGDLRYRIELLETLPPAEKNTFVWDTGRMFDTYLSSEIFALTPGEEKNISFTYPPASVPAGNYRLQIQSTTSQGKDLGWDTVPVTLQGSVTQFVDLVPGTILLPEFPNELIPPLSGPNVSPSSPFTLRATATNPGNASVTVTPTVTVYDFATSGEIVSTQPIANVELVPGKATELSIPVTASATPGVYYAVLSLNSANTRVSALAEYRWVVRGGSGKILSARIKQLQTKANEKVSVSVEYAGPADAETEIQGKMTIEVVDTQGVAGTFQVPETLELSDGIGGGVAGVTLTRDLTGAPGLRVTLTDIHGAVLDVYEVAIPLSGEQLQTLAQENKDIVASIAKSKSSVLYILLGSVILGVFALVLYLQKKGAAAATVLGLFLVIAATLNVAHGQSGAGNGVGIEVISPKIFSGAGDNGYGGLWEAEPSLTGKPLVEVFINSPDHDAPGGTYEMDAVLFGYRIEYGACGNTPPEAWLKVRFDRHGGKHSDLLGSGTPNWFQIIDLKWTNGCQFSWQYCLRSAQGEALLDLSSLSQAATSTTLQIGSFWENFDASDESCITGHCIPATPSFTLSDWFVVNRHAHIVNMWINPVAVALPPSVDLKINGSDNPADVVVNTGITLSWTSSQVSSCTATIDWTGAKPTAGTGSATPTQVRTYTYTITCSGISGQATDTVSINSIAAPQVVTVDLKINGTDSPPNVALGNSITLSWTASANANTCAATGDWGGSKSVPTGSQIDTPAQARTYTYAITCTNTASGATGTDTVNIVVDAPSGVPIAIAKMSIDGITYSNSITVTQNVPYTIYLTAGEHGNPPGSSDPDGWDHPLAGVSEGGNIKWNSDLNLGAATFETTYSNPQFPTDADMNLGQKTFTLAPSGSPYTYNLLQITDATGNVSPIGTVNVTVVSATPSPSPSPSPSFNPGGGFEETR